MDIFTLSGKFILEGKEALLGGLDQVDKKAGSASLSLGKMAAAIGLGGGAIVLAKKGFDLFVDSLKEGIEFIQDTINEAGQQESALVRLNAILKATNQYTEENSEALIENSKALQDKTIYTDEEVLAAEAQLAIYKLTKDEMIEATSVIADMAAAMDTDLGSAASMAGKAMEGIVTPLRRYGIILDEERYKTEGASYVLEVLRSRFQGVAEEAANTSEGLKKQIGNQLGELKETIGGAFLPTLKTLMDGFLHGTPIVNDFGEEIGRTKSPLSNLQDFAGKAAEKIKSFLDKLSSADWSSAVEGLKLIGRTLSALITGNSSFEMTDQKAQDFADTLAEITKTVAGFTNAVNMTSQALVILYKVWDLITMGGPIGIFREGVEQLTYSIQGNKDAIIANIQEQINLDSKFQDISDSLVRLVETGENFGKTTDQSSDSLNNNAQAADTATQALDENSQAQENNAEATEKDTQAINNERDAFNSLIDTLFDSITSYNDFQEANWAVEEAQKALTEAIKQYGKGSKEAEQAQNDLDRANITAIETAFKLSTAIGATTEEQEEARNKAIELGFEYINTGQISEEAFIKMASQFGLSVEDIIGNAKAMGIKLDEATISRIVTVGMNTEGVEAGVRGVWKTIAGLPIFIDIPVYIGKNANNLAGLVNAPGVAEGGLVTSPGSVLVGEYGPELLNLPTGAKVTPLEKANNGKSPIINIYPQWNQEFTDQTVLRLIRQELGKVS